MFKKLLKFIVPGTFMLCIFLLPQSAYAVTSASQIELELVQKIGISMQFFFGLLQELMWPFLVHLGELMGSDMITGPGMEDRLWAIWVQIRDLVNICFVLVLLVTAFYNVLGIDGGEGNLAIKTALPKIVIGLILVNFTFVAGKLVIDVSSVATTAVFALPELVEDFEITDVRTELAKKMCTKSGADSTGTVLSYEVGSSDTPSLTSYFCEEDADKKHYTGRLNSQAERNYFQRLNSANIGLVMAVNMGALNSQKLLNTENIKTLEDIIQNVTFSVIITLVLLVSYVVLALVLIARIVVLWLVLAFSPLGVLVYVVPQLKDLMGGGGDISQKIIKHLLAPIIIGISLTVGYLMLSALDGNIQSQTLGALGGKNILISGMDNLSQVIIMVASVVVIWVGVFAAASDTLAGFVTDGIKGMGESVGKEVAKLPLQFASIPVWVPKDDGPGKTKVDFSALDMFAGSKNLLSNYTQGRAEKQNERLTKINPMLASRWSTQKPADQLTALRSTIQNEVDDNKLNSFMDTLEGIARQKNVTDPALFTQLRAAIDKSKSSRDPSILATFLQDNKGKFKLDETREEKEAIKNLIDTLKVAEYTETPPVNPTPPPAQPAQPAPPAPPPPAQPAPPAPGGTN